MNWQDFSIIDTMWFQNFLSKIKNKSSLGKQKQKVIQKFKKKGRKKIIHGKSLTVTQFCFYRNYETESESFMMKLVITY